MSAFFRKNKDKKDMPQSRKNSDTNTQGVGESRPESENEKQFIEGPKRCSTVPHAEKVKTVRKNGPQQIIHGYSNMTSEDRAMQVNGNMGFNSGDTCISRHRYIEVHARGESRQLNGDIGKEVAKAFWT